MTARPLHELERAHKALRKATETYDYLIREWESYGVIDATNMRHVYEAAKAGRAALMAERAIVETIAFLDVAIADRRARGIEG